MGIDEKENLKYRKNVRTRASRFRGKVISNPETAV